METLLQDLRYGLRMLRKSPAFTAVAVLALALGIGANTAIFSVINAVLLRPLPFKDSDQLALIWTKFTARGVAQSWLSIPEYVDLKESSTQFEDFAILRDWIFDFTGRDEPEMVQAALVSANLFPMLGVNPAVGRGFVDEDDKRGAGKVVIMSHPFWMRRFGGDRNVVGQQVTLGGASYTVIGVMPPDFRILPPSTVFPKQVDLWAPVFSEIQDHFVEGRTIRHLHVIGRIKPGVTVAQAQSEMDSIAQSEEERFQDAYKDRGYGLTVAPFQEHLIKSVRPALWIMLGAVGFVLMIACANVGNLLLARAAAREREIAIRTALGAARRRIFRQLLTESIILSLLGGAVGLLLAYFGIKLLVAISPGNIPRLNETITDSRVLIFTLLVSLIAPIIFGLIPAFQASRPNLNETLNEGGRSGKGGIHGQRIRNALVVAEIALALVLLIGTGLMVKSFMRMQEADLGFQPENLLTMRVMLPERNYPNNPKRVEFSRHFVEQLRPLPGVQAVGGTTHLPLSGSALGSTFEVEGNEASQGGEPFIADMRGVTPDYFNTMRVQLVSGREFNDMDQGGGTGLAVAIIDEKLASRFPAGQDPVGKRIRWTRANQWLQVVGVVKSINHGGPNEPPTETVYRPFSQYPHWLVYVTLRTNGDPVAMVNTVRNKLWATDRDLPISDVHSMQELFEDSIGQPRFNTYLLGIFALIALILAVIGIYGVMSYSVTERTHEIGLRMALGAQPGDVLRLIVRRGMTLAIVGISIGLIAAYFMSTLISRLLYNVSRTDPITYVIISVILAGAALLASYIPARRATKVDPMEALRYE